MYLSGHLPLKRLGGAGSVEALFVAERTQPPDRLVAVGRLDDPDSAGVVVVDVLVGKLLLVLLRPGDSLLADDERVNAGFVAGIGCGLGGLLGSVPLAVRLRIRPRPWLRATLSPQLSPGE